MEVRRTPRIHSGEYVRDETTLTLHTIRKSTEETVLILSKLVEEELLLIIL